MDYHSDIEWLRSSSYLLPVLTGVITWRHHVPKITKSMATLLIYFFRKWVLADVLINYMYSCLLLLLKAFRKYYKNITISSTTNQQIGLRPFSLIFTRRWKIGDVDTYRDTLCSIPRSVVWYTARGTVEKCGHHRLGINPAFVVTNYNASQAPVQNKSLLDYTEQYTEE